jgi:hypothetical protein
MGLSWLFPTRTSLLPKEVTPGKASQSADGDAFASAVLGLLCLHSDRDGGLVCSCLMSPPGASVDRQRPARLSETWGKFC